MTMDSVFEKNMEVLAERYPDLAERVKSTPDDPAFRIINSKTGKPNVLVKRDSKFVMLYDNDDPEQYCKKYLRGLDLKYAPIVAFMGLGLGYHLNHFFTQISEKVGTRHIIVFEKEIGLFRLALKMGDFRQAINHPNLQLFVGESPNDIFVRSGAQIFSIRDAKIAIKSLKIVPLPANVMLEKDYYEKVVASIVRSACQKMSIAGNDSMDSFVGLENLLLNVKHIFSNPGVYTLFGKFKGKPGILVASGPSLNKNMHYLKGLSEKALIASCDASFVPLMKQMIRPHIVGTHERTPGTHLFFKGIENFHGTYLVAPPIIMPESIDGFKGRKFMYSRGFSHFYWFEKDLGSLPSGFSVANMMFKFLEALGCDPIILIGQDLSYRDDGATHPDGHVLGTHHDDIVQEPVIEIEGNDGRPVKTFQMFEYQRATFEEDIAAYKGKCINATEEGAKIYGAEVMPFKDVIEQYCNEEFHPPFILDEIYSQFEENVNIEARLRGIQNKASESCKHLEALIEEFKKALDKANKADKEIVRPYIEKGLGKVDMNQLTAIEKSFLDLSEGLAKDTDIFNLMAHSLNAYDVHFSNELGFLRDIYTDETCLAMARVRKIKDWFAVVGQFLVLTRDVLRKAEGLLAEQTGKRDRELDSLEARGAGDALP